MYKYHTYVYIFLFILLYIHINVYLCGVFRTLLDALQRPIRRKQDRKDMKIN